MRFFELQQVDKIYRKGFSRKAFQALSQIELTVDAGETVGFIGHNGAGKSSTIRIMLGLQKPTQGAALIRGVPATSHLARKGIAYVPEVPLIYDHLTPNELLSMSLRLHGYSGNADRQRKEWLERLGLSRVADKRVRGFSKGMVQRTALAMALCTDPEALVLDEPLSGLDPLGRREVVEVLDECRHDGKTIFFSSHVLSDVERLADRFVFIHQGGIRGGLGIDAVLQAAADNYEVIIYSAEGLPEYLPAGRGLWRRTVSTDELPNAIDTVRSTGAMLHSVRSAANLEQLYVRLVEEAGDKPRN